MHTPNRSSSRLAALPLSLLLLSLPTACTGDTAAAPATAPTPAPAKAALPAPATAAAPATAPVNFGSTNMTIKGKAFAMEVAQGDTQIQRGLMYRDQMESDHGMLFVMDSEYTWSFWMKNTRIPLDIIFLDKNGRVLAIQARKPFDETGMGPDSPALYVIELNLGMAQKLGLQRGDTVQIPQKYLKNAPASTDK